MEKLKYKEGEQPTHRQTAGHSQYVPFPHLTSLEAGPVSSENEKEPHFFISFGLDIICYNAFIVFSANIYSRAVGGIGTKG